MKEQENFMGLSVEELMQLQDKVEENSYTTGVVYGTLLQQEFQQDCALRHRKRWRRLSAGIIALAIIFVAATNIISSHNDTPRFNGKLIHVERDTAVADCSEKLGRIRLKTSQESDSELARAALDTAITKDAAIDAVDLSAKYKQAMDIIECPIRLANIDGLDAERYTPDQWLLSEDQDVLVWLDLPNNVDEFHLNISSTYPYEVKAGETGTIQIKAVDTYEHKTYTGTLEFRAEDDLTIGALTGHGGNLRNESLEVHNGNTLMLPWMQPGKHAYIHYGLYTSCEGKYGVATIDGGENSVGYYASYTIEPLGAPEVTWTDYSEEL